MNPPDHLGRSHAYGYRDKRGRVRSITMSEADAARNARLNGSTTLVRLPLVSHRGDDGYPLGVAADGSGAEDYPLPPRQDDDR